MVQENLERGRGHNVRFCWLEFSSFWENVWDRGECKVRSAAKFCVILSSFYLRLVIRVEF